MNHIRMRETGEVITDYEYRVLHPQTSFMEGFTPEDGDRIVATPPPAVTMYERVVRNGVEQVDDEWREVWLIVPALAPESVPMLSARLALSQQGHMAAVNSHLADWAGTEGEQARIFFEFAQNVRRDHQVVESLRQLLDLTSAQIDELFILASTLD